MPWDLFGNKDQLRSTEFSLELHPFATTIYRSRIQSPADSSLPAFIHNNHAFKLCTTEAISLLGILLRNAIECVFPTLGTGQETGAAGTNLGGRVQRWNIRYWYVSSSRDAEMQPLCSGAAVWKSCRLRI